MKKIVIFGAQAIALGTYKAIKKIHSERDIVCFLVSKMGINASVLAGLAVKEIDSFAVGLSQIEKEDIEVWIATPEPVMPEIEVLLKQYGFCNYKRITSKVFADLMEMYFTDSQEFVPLSELQAVVFRECDDKAVGCEVKEQRTIELENGTDSNVQVFMAKFYKDKKLEGTYEIPEWVTPIQVGAALCEERVVETLDCNGENISHKNVNYSELTALYWVWKNKLEMAEEDEMGKYYGLAHYRRMLVVSKEHIMRLGDNDVDVVLPYPMPYEPSIHVHHERYLKEIDWRALLQALEELQPEYARLFPEILEQQYMYNYNIILAKKEVLRDYCRWLFSILERTEELSVPKGRDRADRYIGYMGETLETLYFMVNKERLKIVHTGCQFFT